jgi:uncharacterized membrane protein
MPGAMMGRRALVASIERSIEVEVPVRTAYNQWTQFEEFPRFMEGVTVQAGSEQVERRGRVA